MIKLLKLSKEAYEYYTENVKGNENTSYETAQKKLTRNVLLAYKKDPWKHALKLKREYIYGNLKVVVQFNRIVQLQNNVNENINGWKVDKAEYIRLSKLLGIPHGKYSKK